MKDTYSKENKQLSTSIIKRFLSEEDFERFYEEYMRSKKIATTGSKSRFELVESPISDAERAVLVAYFDKTKKNAHDVAALADIKPSRVRALASSGALKVLYRLGNTEELLAQVK